MSSGKNLDKVFDLNVVPPDEEGSEGIKHTFDLNVTPPVDEVDTCDLIPGDNYGVVDNNDASRKEEYQVSMGRGKRKLIDSQSYDVSGEGNNSASMDMRTSGVSVIREGSEECHNLPPKPQLPPSSKYLELDGIPLFDVFLVYAFLRTFSMVLFLSPFEFEDFVAAVRCETPTVLFDCIHLSLLQTLKKHLEYISRKCESASTCLRSLNWSYLDIVTWPIFMMGYFLMHGSLSRPGFSLRRLKPLESDYYKQSAAIKIEMLKCMCDDVSEGEIIRSELNRRASQSNLAFDQRGMLRTPKKKKPKMDVSGSSSTAQNLDGTTDHNSQVCSLCQMEGRLVRCDGCPSAFHPRCVGILSNALPEGDWYCPECRIDHDKPWTTAKNAVRGAYPLGVDPYGRRYYNSCGYLLVLDLADEELPLRYYHRNDLAVVIKALKASPTFGTTLLSAIRKLWNVRADVKTDSALGIGYEVAEAEIVQNTAMKGRNEIASSEVSAENSQAITGRGSALSNIDLTKNIPQVQHANYVNLYRFAQTTSSVAEALLRKPSGKNYRKSRSEEMISGQLKIISNVSNEFSWSNIRNLDVDAKKAKCGWCIACKDPEVGCGCLFLIKNSDSFLNKFTSGLLGICPSKNKKGRFTDIVCQIICIEDRLHGLLSGPWLNSEFSHVWRKAVCEASDLGPLKHSLVILASNLYSRALSPEWHKEVDSAKTIGSASHIEISSLLTSSEHGVSRKRVHYPNSSESMSSKHGVSRKRARYLSEPTSLSNAVTGLRLLWWRGGRISRELYKWKLLPCSLVSAAARQAGIKKIPGILYSEGKKLTKRCRYVAWSAAVEASSTVEQLALQVRELDANIKWDDFENINLLSKMDKKFGKSVRHFKGAIIRQKSSDGKYLLDFGRTRYIPDVVKKHGSRVEESSSKRRKFWLEESYVPLNLIKGFEDKRIAQNTSKSGSTDFHGCEVSFKKPHRKMGFSYLFAKAERLEIYQCGHCNEDVPIREVAGCQYCEGMQTKANNEKKAQKSKRSAKEINVTWPLEEEDI